MPRLFFPSSGARWLDRPAVIVALRRAAHRLRRERPDVEAVYLFGSLATGTATPRSDADILIVVRAPVRGDARSLIDRIPDYLSFFRPIPVPVDVIPCPSGAVEQRPMLRRARSEGIRLDVDE
ncbi:MAG: nucleotidyltransferase domain-containing protein [Candidatus Latescibacteria bacterium]|nr:nucleotidyltransferase domain-containing protein [Candidatus Latescibacterota bacterium]